MSQTTETMQPEQIFNQALALQNQKKYDEALTEYKKLLDISQLTGSNVNAEQVSAASHNISLIYLEQKQDSLAAVYNQKSLALNPRNSAAEKLFEQHKNWVTQPNFNREITWQENLNSVGFKFLSIELLLISTGILLFFLIKKYFAFLISQKKFETGSESRPQLQWSFYSLLFFTTIAVIFCFLKWMDQSKTKALILANNVQLTTLPGENQAVITDLSQGLVVEVLKSTVVNEQVYVQTKYPGAFSGWVKKQDLELLNRLYWP